MGKSSKFKGQSSKFKDRGEKAQRSYYLPLSFQLSAFSFELLLIISNLYVVLLPTAYFYQLTITSTGWSRIFR